jgi:hypothetical protein
MARYGEKHLDKWTNVIIVREHQYTQMTTDNTRGGLSDWSINYIGPSYHYRLIENPSVRGRFEDQIYLYWMHDDNENI